MKFITQTFDKPFDLATDEAKQQAGQEIVSLASSIISKIVEAVQNNSFDFTLFSFDKKLESGLTGKCGLYLIINKKTKRFYIGSASNLAQRKGEHKQNFTSAARRSKLALAFRADLDEGQFEDFTFVPVLILNLSITKDLSDKTLNQKVKDFLDTYVEKPIISYYLDRALWRDAPSEDPVKGSPTLIYNVKLVGTFESGNSFGGAPSSGSPSRAIAYTTTINGQAITYAWESISAASNTFDVDRKLIRTKLQKNKMVYLTLDDYNQFSGPKISNKDATTFFIDRQAEYKQILKELFPNKKIK